MIKIRLLQLLTFLTIQFCLTAIFTIGVSAFSGSGAGTDGDPYQITTCDQLQEIESNKTASYRLENDIDCADTSTWNSGAGFNPIGSSGAFEGVLNGQGHTISGLFIDRTSQFAVGLFAIATENAKVYKLNFADSNIAGNRVVGTVLGSGAAYIFAVNVTNGQVSGNHQFASVGGLVGDRGTRGIYHSSFSGTVTASFGGPANYAGGLVGSSIYGSIYDSYANATVTAGGYAGGLVGASVGGEGLVYQNSYAIGSVTAHIAGGIVGLSDYSMILRNSFAATDVSASDIYGGLVGRLNSPSSTVTNSYWDLTTTGATDCVGQNSFDTGTCSSIDLGEEGEDYFFLSANPPLSSWDFTNIWQTVADNYPSLRAPGTLSVPSVPLNLLFENTGFLAVSAEWDEPSSSGGSPILAYDTQIKRGAADWADYISQSTPSAAKNVAYSNENLLILPDTEYQIRVRAYNIIGASAWTDTASITTGSGATQEITSCEEMFAADDEPGTYADTILLMNNIDCTGVETRSLFRDSEYGVFTGTFDGQNHTISNLSVDFGFFYFLHGATVKNVTFSGGEIFGDDRGGGTLARVALSVDIENVHSNVPVTLGLDEEIEGSAGGIVGYIEADPGYTVTLDNISYTGTLSAPDYEEVGGIIGSLNALSRAPVLASNLHSSGNVTGANSTGGLLGKFIASSDTTADATATLSDSSSTATVTGVSQVGGLVGFANGHSNADRYASAVILRSFATGNVSGQSSTGGLVGYGQESADFYIGYSKMEIRDSYATGNVSGITNDDAVNQLGGLVGLFSGRMYSSYASGTVTGNAGSTNIGGLVGFIYITHIEDSFSVSHISGDSLVASVIGGSFFIGPYLDNVFFDQDIGGVHCQAQDYDLGSCTGISGQPNYFKGNHTNEPLSSWDFSGGPWYVVTNGLPVLIEPDADPTPTPSATVTPTPTVTPTTAHSSNSGTTPTPVITPTTIQISLDDYFEYLNATGKELELEVGDVIHFTVTKNGITEEHTITIIEVGSDYVVVTIASDPFNATLKIAQTGTYDVNSDQQDDISLTLASITNGKPSLIFKKLQVNALPVTPTKTTLQTTGLPATGEGAQSATNWWFMAAIAGVGLTVVVLFFFFKKRDKKLEVG